MGKRCNDIECAYLAEDLTCLLKPEELRLKCPAREKTRHEDKDIWMDRIICVKTNGNPSRRKRERMIMK